METIGGRVGTKAAENRLQDGAANASASVRRQRRRARGLGSRSGSSAVGRAGAGVAPRKPKDFADVEVLKVRRDQRTTYFAGRSPHGGRKLREGLAPVDVRS